MPLLRQNESTKVGRGGGEGPPPDILLQGLGIHPQHAQIDVKDGQVCPAATLLTRAMSSALLARMQMFVTPFGDAKVRVNGRSITVETRLR